MHLLASARFARQDQQRQRLLVSANVFDKPLNRTEDYFIQPLTGNSSSFHPEPLLDSGLRLWSYAPNDGRCVVIANQTDIRRV